MKKIIIKALFGILIFLLLLNLNNVFNLSASNVVKTADEFYQALSRQEQNIKTADIDFNGDVIEINYNVTITSNNDYSTFKDVYFIIKGSINDTFVPTITFKNIIFDGACNLDDYDLKSNDDFETIFGSEREDKRCINGDYGYYNLILDHIKIKNYISDVGPCLFVENVMRDYKKHITVSNCEFYDNVSTYNSLHLSNDKLVVDINNSKFYHNYAYKGAGFSISNADCNIDKVNVHDNYFCNFDVNTSDLQLCGGGVFLGGCNVNFTNSTITNNETTFGGGLGITSSMSGNKNIIIKNIIIKNNKAKYGGAVSIHSRAGQTINFLNCDFSNNVAVEGSTFYTTVYAHWLKENNGGLINVLFSSILLNSADDNNTFGFYLKDKTKGSIGSFAVKGCFIIGDDIIDEDETNYVASLEKALNDKVVNEDINTKIVDNIIYPNKKSIADKKISPKTYHEFSPVLASYNKTLKVGYNKNFDKKAINFIYVIIPLVVILIILLVFGLVKKHKKQVVVEDDNNKSEIDERQLLIDSLTERELQVFKLLIKLKKRKEIADELYYSENTIKKDVSSIYKKLKVSDKSELIAKYQEFI